jgi:hypothetical protein
MFTQVFRRLEPSFSFLGRDIQQARAESLDIFFVRLELSQALAAVWSPGTAQKFNDQRTLRKEIM